MEYKFSEGSCRGADIPRHLTEAITVKEKEKEKKTKSDLLTSVLNYKLHRNFI